MKQTNETAVLEQVTSDVEQHNAKLMFCSYAGSISYGLATPQSDTDIRGFYLPSPRDIVFGTARETQITQKESDTVIYSFLKFASLCKTCNPNILELLAIDRKFIIYAGTEYEAMRSQAELLHSMKAAKAFKGYAEAQAKQAKAIAQKMLSFNDEQRENAARKCSKLMSHALRVYHMGIEMLEGSFEVERHGEERDLLMAVKSGAALDASNGAMDSCYIEDLNCSRERFDKLRKETKIREQPSTQWLEELEYQILVRAIDNRQQNI